MGSKVITALAMALALSVAGVAAAEPEPQQKIEFKRSDPALVDTPGAVRLVEFFHPT